MPSLAVLRFERLGLRTRITIAFAFGGLLVSIIIALATLGLTRQNLLAEPRRHGLRRFRGQRPARSQRAHISYR